MLKLLKPVGKKAYISWSRSNSMKLFARKDKKMKMPKIGYDIGPRPMNIEPYDFFRTRKKDYPVNMFKDNDRDGVPNVFDCKPNNPKKQGIITAIGGLFRKKEKVTPPKQYESIQAFKEQQKAQIAKRKETVEQQKMMQGIAKKVAAEKEAEYKKSFVGRMVTGAKRRLVSAGEGAVRYATNVPKGRGAARVPLRGARMLFPFLPEGTTVIRGQGKKKVGGGRGRPRGAFAGKYAAYGGVFGYRKAMRAAKAFQKYKAVVQRAQMQNQLRQARMVRQQMQQMPQYQNQEMPEIPVEMQMQMEQMAQQGQEQSQYPQQLPQQIQPVQQRREVRPVFRGSGGSPFRPVATSFTQPSQLLERSQTQVSQAPPEQHLAPVRETAPDGYVEATDPWTGRRFIKRLPPQERWQGE